jgi:hypothetical protein
MKCSKYMATAAAVLILTAGVASAQGLMKAEVPFAFQVGGKVVEAGTIRVKMLYGNTGDSALIVSNYDAKRAHIALPKSVGDAPKNWVASGVAKIAFDCSTGACMLAKVWYGEGHAYEFYGPKTRSGETLLTEIVLIPDKAD